ncbi:hypothetical protein FRX31_031227 [Thalictrum thalictroides]|uniref:Uncharacterized protein n=1 Tax=Thalictrum thalictroides TaxID=46969 RepID=A0A7J6V2Z9_THATH|nr:hypothetical protein FRX31_031227 [Thalictrum thalictroides]
MKNSPMTVISTLAREQMLQGCTSLVPPLPVAGDYLTTGPESSIFFPVARHLPSNALCVPHPLAVNWEI